MSIKTYVDIGMDCLWFHHLYNRLTDTHTHTHIRTHTHPLSFLSSLDSGGSITSETDSCQEGGGGYEGDHGFNEPSYPQLNDIDFDMDTTEYEIYRDYIDDAEDDKDTDPDDRAGREESVAHSTVKGSEVVQSSSMTVTPLDVTDGVMDKEKCDKENIRNNSDASKGGDNEFDNADEERRKVKDINEGEKPLREPVSFPSRLFDVLSEENPSIIQWKDKGTSFHITDVTSFVRDILFNRFKRTYIHR